MAASLRKQEHLLLSMLVVILLLLQELLHGSAVLIHRPLLLQVLLLTLGCNPSASDINAALGSATATDACSTPTVTSSDGTCTIQWLSRSQTRTFTASDGCGNSATASATVTWIADLTATNILQVVLLLNRLVVIHLLLISMLLLVLLLQPMLAALQL